MKYYYTLAILLLGLAAKSQRFGGTPTMVKWNQISTDTARIIFQKGLEAQAQRVATVIHEQAALNTLPLGGQMKKINIVLQNHTVIPNGYVGLGPYRSEFYLTPELNNFDQGSIPWVDQLALHEYRHVQQFNNFRNGISRIMKTLFGEEGYSLAINASVPDWFYEGDAVYQETALSRQGRGRLPLFLNAYPSLWKEGKNYSWMKMRNGSLKDFVPDHYNLGYLLVQYGYEKYGPDFWEKVTRDASSLKGIFYPFQKAIERHAGIDFKTFRGAAIDQYKKMISGMALNGASQAKPDQGEEAGYKIIQPVNKQYVTNSMFPYHVDGDSLLYVKTTYRHRPAFFLHTGNGEKRLRTMDIALDRQFSYRGGKLVYAAYERDIRWAWRDYSVIKLLDIRTGRQRTITRRSKYFTPDISPSGDRIVAVELASDGSAGLHVLDASTGSLIKKIPAGEIKWFTDPKFIGSDSVVSAVRYSDGTMALALIDLNTGAQQRLTPPTYHVLGYPFAGDEMIYFTASYEGSDNLFAIRKGETEIRRITGGLEGKYFVNAGGGRVTWSRFSAEGYQLQEMEEKRMHGEIVGNAATLSRQHHYQKDQTGARPDFLEGLKVNRSYEIRRYSKATRLFNFHSWRPYYEDPEFSFSLYGQNVLNTMETELYYLYNQNENTNAAGFNMVYGGFFPYISGGTQYTFNRIRSINNRTRQWDQLDTRIGLIIPISITSGRSFKNFNAGTYYVYRNDRITGTSRQDFPNLNFSYLIHTLNFSVQVQQAVQHIFPRVGISVSAQQNHAISNNDSWQFLSGAVAYLPGFASTHHLVLTGAWQETDTLNNLFSNRFSYSRGYNEAYLSRMWRGSANYHFPLVYPDWGFSNILYLLRVRANAFFDFTRVYSNNKAVSRDQRSAGGELYVDTKWWNQYELSFGVRVSRLLDNDLFTRSKRTVFEFILPVSIFPR